MENVSVNMGPLPDGHFATGVFLIIINALP
jgi:hypothetical protein